MRELLGEAYYSLWVAGEAQRVRAHRRGHLYFELVEKGEGDEIVGKLEAVIWRKDLERVRRTLAGSGLEIADGVQIRCRANLDFYAPFGRLQLVVREVDPVFTEGLLAERRRRTLEKLAAAGLLERNRELPLPELPLSVGLVTSEGSAAYHDFVSTLRESPYGFRVLFVHAAVQGGAAERELVSALATLAAARGRGGAPAIDCAVMIRGGGSRTDLAVFDSRPLAEAVARAPFPVLTGLGHEIDRSVADLVAHTSLKTPTKVAELLVQRVAKADGDLTAASAALRRVAFEPLRRGQRAIGSIERQLRLVGYRVEAERRRVAGLAARLARSTRRLLVRGDAGLGELRRRLAVAGPRLLAARSREPRRLHERLASVARSRVREVSARLDGVGRLCAELAPERTLERGFTITRDAAGRLLRDAAEVASGDRITTTLGKGRLVSRVEERVEER